jgi:hypothetical protein
VQPAIFSTGKDVYVATRSKARLRLQPIHD